jgi:hypothetical protein
MFITGVMFIWIVLFAVSIPLMAVESFKPDLNIYFRILFWVFKAPLVIITNGLYIGGLALYYDDKIGFIFIIIGLLALSVQIYFLIKKKESKKLFRFLLNSIFILSPAVLLTIYLTISVMFNS